MATNLAGPPPPLLPLLLSLAPGAVVGVSRGILNLHPTLESELSAFGPRVGSERELRHAVGRVPSRLVLEFHTLDPPLVGAALPLLRRGGAVVVLCADDRGLLARWAERLLTCHAGGARWVAVETVRATRVLELRIECPPAGRSEWVRLALGGGDGAEAMLAAVRAEGKSVRESRIAYGPCLAR